MSLRIGWNILAGKLWSSAMQWLTLVLTSTIFFSGVMPSQAILDGYTPLSPSDLKRKVALTPVSDAGLKDGKSIKIGTAEMILPAEGDDLLFSGKDKKGKPWSLTKRYYGLGTSFYTRDLDCNGTTDIILLQSTGACGIAPPAVLSILLFDKDLRPFPIEVSGYAYDDDDRKSEKKVLHIADLITFGSDKRAVLICNQLDSAQLKNRYGSFWRIQLYRANHGRWERIKKYKGKDVPMIVRYTFKPNVKVISNPVPSLRTFEDGASGTADSSRFITGTVKQVEMENDRVKSLKISPNLSFEPWGWSLFHPFFIKDKPDKYELLAAESDEAEKLMRTMADKKIKLRYLKPIGGSKQPQYLWIVD